MLRLCLLIGSPVSHSLSPKMFNRAFIECGLAESYYYSAVEVSSAELSGAIEKFREPFIRGLSCTMPHKQKLLDLVDEISAEAKEIGAINSIVNENGRLVGHNTDWLGVVHPLQKITSLQGASVAVIGAGGAARSAVYALKRAGSKVTLFNRTVSRAEEIATAFGVRALPLSNHSEIRACDIIVSTVPSQVFGEVVDPSTIVSAKQIVFDIAYFPRRTGLILAAEDAGARCILGTEMLLYQGVEQFRLFTGLEAPIEVMAHALEEENP